MSDVSIAEFDWREKEYATPRKRDAKTFGLWYVMAKSKPAKAFLIHDCCWFLLTKHFGHDEIDLDRLFEVCKNIPASSKAIYHRELFNPTSTLIYMY